MTYYSKGMIVASIRAALYSRRRKANPERSPVSDFDAVLEDTSEYVNKSRRELMALWAQAKGEKK